MTLKQQQRIFRVVSGKWYQRMAFWQWPELIREQHAALQQEARKQVEIRSAMVKLGEWIHATHRLDAPPRKGIRAILAGTRRGVPFLMLLLPALLFGGQPTPFLRNSWSTNAAGTPVQGLNNLSVTNLGSGTNWLFFNVGPTTIARLGDVTNIASSFTGGDAGGTNSRQGGSLVLTNLSNNPTPFTNIIVASTAIALGTNAGITYITNTLNTNAFQPAAENLTNWSNIPTGAMANIPSVTFLTNWANAVSNYVTAATNSASVTNWTISRQPASANLTNWSNIPTGAMANIPAVTFLTNWANSISNLTQTKQNGSAALTNLSGNPNVATNILGAGIVTVSSNNAGTWTITGTSDAGGTNARQFGSATLTNLSNNPYKGYTNEVFGGTNISIRTAGGTNFIDTIGQLNNWSQLTTGSMANVVSTTFLTNWANSISNLAQTKQNGSASLTNLSGNPNVVTQILAGANITVTSNNAGVFTITGSGGSGDAGGTNARQFGSASLTNLSGNPNVATQIVAGAYTMVYSNNAGQFTVLGTNFPWTTNLNINYDMATAIPAVPNGSRVTFTPGTNAVIPSIAKSNGVGAITLNAKTNIVFDGGGQLTLSGRAAPGEIIYLTNCVNITFRGIRFDGLVLTNPIPLVYQWGIVSIAQCDRITFENCEFLNGHNFGLLDIATLDANWQTTTTNGTVRNCYFYNCGSYWTSGLVLDGAAMELAGWLIEGNLIEECLRGVEIFEDNRVVADTIVRRNTIKNTLHYPIFIAGHTNCDSVIIEDNFISNQAGYSRRGTNYLLDAVGILMGTGHRHRIKRNTLIGVNPSGIVIGSSLAPRMDDIVIADNYVQGYNFSYLCGDALVTYHFNLLFSGNVALDAFGPYNFNGLRNSLVTENVAARVLSAGRPGYDFTLSGSVINTNVIISGNSAFDSNGNMNYGFRSFVGNEGMVLGPNQSIGHTIAHVTGDFEYNIGTGTNWNTPGNIAMANLFVTNSATIYSTLTAGSNILVRAGQSASNAFVGGVIYFDMTSNRTNLNATITTFTNLATNSIAANTLTNNGDMVIAEWAGVMANASANTNQFRILYGSQTVIDTGTQIASNCTWNAEVKIARTGNTSQLVMGHFEWGPGGAVPFAFTNVNIVTSQTNGLSTYIALQGAARRVGAHTNNYFRLKYEPAPE